MVKIAGESIDHRFDCVGLIILICQARESPSVIVARRLISGGKLPSARFAAAMDYTYLNIPQSIVYQEIKHD